MNISEFVSLYLLFGVVFSLISHVILDGYKQYPYNEGIYVVITLLLWWLIIILILKSLVFKLVKAVRNERV